METAAFNLAVWAEGGLSLSELRQMPVDQLQWILRSAEATENRRKQESDKLRAQSKGRR